jgi:hypothetical protein
VSLFAHVMIYAMTRHYESSARKSKNLQVEIALEAAELGGTEVGGQDLLGEELAVRDAEGPAGRAPRDEGVGGGCGYRGSWPLREKDACLCGTVRIDASGSGSNRQLLLLLLMSCRFHLEHLVEAAGKLLGNPSLPRFGEADGRGEIDGDFGLHACRLCCFIMTTHSAAAHSETQLLLSRGGGRESGRHKKINGGKAFWRCGGVHTKKISSVFRRTPHTVATDVIAVVSDMTTDRPSNSSDYGFTNVCIRLIDILLSLIELEQRATQISTLCSRELL